MEKTVHKGRGYIPQGFSKPSSSILHPNAMDVDAIEQHEYIQAQTTRKKGKGKAKDVPCKTSSLPPWKPKGQTFRQSHDHSIPIGGDNIFSHQMVAWEAYYRCSQYGHMKANCTMKLNKISAQHINFLMTWALTLNDIPTGNDSSQEEDEEEEVLINFDDDQSEN